MVERGKSDLLTAVGAWLQAERLVESAVLFGSSARELGGAGLADGWSDFDLHIVTADVARLEGTDWSQAMPGQTFALHVVRPATGGVRKVTVLFATGQLDLVLVAAEQMHEVQLGLDDGMHLRPGPLAVALNEMATCLATGYCFLKGEKTWGGLYARVASTMAGVRLSDGEARQQADIFLCELLWVLQKLDRGECMAAQLVLHRSLAETNFRLVRERRLRRGLPLPSFGLARRAELLWEPAELALVRVDARLNSDELRHAAWQAFTGLKALMHDLVPGWSVPVEVDKLLAPFSPAARRA